MELHEILNFIINFWEIKVKVQGQTALIKIWGSLLQQIYW